MGNKLYVGNLSFSVNDNTLIDHFSKHGTVVSAKVIIDRDTNRSKGFGFVEMSTSAEAQKAIDSLNGAEIEGRQMAVNEAKPQERKTGGGGGRGGFGGDRGGRSRY